MAEEASLPTEGGMNLACARKECSGCWMLGNPMGFRFATGAFPAWSYLGSEAIPGMAVCQEWVGVGMPGR